MKTSLQFLLCGITLPKAIAALGAALAVTLNVASANVIMDLRVGGVSGAGSIADSKTVLGVDVGSIVTLQVWAEITPDGNPVVNNIFGIQSVVGSIISHSSPATGGNVRGNMSPSVPLAPFNVTAVPGTVAELSDPPDGSLDLGTSSTTSITGKIKFRSDPGSGEASHPGETFFFTTNNVPRGATFNPISSGGYEFLLGTADFTIQELLDPSDPAISLNWVFSAFTTPALKGIRASWTQGDGVNDTGNLQSDLLAVGDAVTISAEAIPEPGAFAILLSGVASLVTFQRRRFRKTS